MADENPNADALSKNEDLSNVHDSMMDGLGQLADYFGFSKVMGQLYGTLLLNPGPLSLDDMMERLEISKASVSMNMRTLEHMGMVRQVWVRGGSGRRKYYEAESDFWEIISTLLSGREMRDVERAISVMEENRERLLEAIPEMSTEEADIAKLYLDRMQQMQSLFRFAQMVITTILNQVKDADISEINHIEID